MNSSLQQELSQLAQSIGLSPLQGVSLLKDNRVRRSEDLARIDAQKLYSDALARSFEIKTFQSLIFAAKANVNSARFSFLDPSSSSGLGFGTVSEIRMAKSEVKQIELKKTAFMGSLQQMARAIATKQDEIISSLTKLEKLKKSQKAKVQQIIQMHIMGSFSRDRDEFDYINDLALESQKLLETDISYNALYSSLDVNKSKMNRILLEGFYNNLDSAIP